MKKKVLVWILMGSESDRAALQPAADSLKTWGVAHRMVVASAHRTPRTLRRILRASERAGGEIYIAGAGGAAHLPGVVASLTLRPVLGVPMRTKLFRGLDSVLSILQMPSGVPVATMAVGSAGAKNAAVLALEILALKYPVFRRRLRALRPQAR
ncbi:MAG: 5-(carboxyamino)imidazole ribonucleotide mutase [Elusimicrobia bacterium]|nr:5-(carboxyamino)imidazole ribonucleotide mutase [Elusimicrobiota bacterium]